jgi:hypothetical protein
MMTSLHITEVPLIKLSIQDLENHTATNVNAER